MFTWIILSVAFFSDSNPENEVEPVASPITRALPQQTITPVSVSTWEGVEVSAQPLVNSIDTEQVTEEGFYKNTAVPDSYAIYYFEPNGSLSVQLFKEPLGLSRSFAEQQLRTIFDLTDEELCELRIEVSVHEMVSPEYSRNNLGLSFCPNGLALPNTL